MTDTERLTLADLQPCFTGLVPLALATVSGGGVPNVTLLSRAHQVDDERLALSNQFLSKSHRNLAEDPHACLLLVHPDSLEEFRVWVVFEQTVRRGPVFDRLRDDLSMVAALTGMQGVFRLRAADIVRVTEIERVVVGHRGAAEPVTVDELPPPEPTALGELGARLARAGDLDTLIQMTLQGLTELLGYEHSLLLLLDEDGDSLFTIGSHGYEHEGVGSEVVIGEGVAGLAAQRCEPVRARSVQQMQKYARSVRASFERAGELEQSPTVPMPGLAEPGSQVAVPAVSLGQLVGVLLVESTEVDRFDDDDVGVLTVVASLVASLVEHFRSETLTVGPDARVTAPPARAAGSAAAGVSRVRHYTGDGSTFIDDDYLTKGVAGRILWSLLRQYSLEGRTDFTNRETRLDPTLELPDFRDNFESRLVLLKRRLDERDARIRIEKTGRGRFRLVVDGALRLEAVES